MPFKASSGSGFDGASRGAAGAAANQPPFYLKNDISGAPCRGSPQKGHPRAGSGGPFPRSMAGRGDRRHEAWRDTLAPSVEVATLLRRGRERAVQRQMMAGGGDGPLQAWAGGAGGRVDSQFGAWNTRPLTVDEGGRESMATERWAGNNWGSLSAIWGD